jgi:bifunctional non-homologous end joining protein LigD
MKAVTGPLPTSDEGWAYEIKWDGMRLLAYVEPGQDPPVRLVTTRRHDAIGRFPELAGLARATGGRPAVLDGEVVAQDAEGRPDFGLLQTRMHLTDAGEVAARVVDTPVTFQVFDILWFDGHDVTGQPYEARRDVLAAVVEEGDAWCVPGHHVGNGKALYAAAEARGLEGLVAKRLDSPYLPGKRSPTWRKVKIRRRQELVVGGWLPGEGARSATVGALLVGYHDDTGLRYAGRVGTGFSDRELRRVEQRLRDLAQDRSPFVDELPAPARRLARWVRPEMVVEVEFGEWTGDGRLRHPSYLGERTDKDPADVVREP